MLKILTIDDLLDADDEEISEVKSRINLRQAFMSGGRALGQRVGMTLNEYHAHLANPQTETCHVCSGSGVFTRKVRSVGGIHASAAHFCRTRLYFDASGAIAPRPNFPLKLNITFSIGHGIHHFVQRAMKTHFGGLEGHSFQEEVKVDLPDAMVWGSSADVLVDYPFARVLGEVKSIGKEFDKLVAPKPEHLIQAMGIYANGLNAPFVSYLYVSKYWPHHTKEFVLPYDPSVFRRWWKKKGSLVEEGLEDGEPPVADSTKNECRQCPYGYACEQNLAV